MPDEAGLTPFEIGGCIEEIVLPWSLQDDTKKVTLSAAILSRNIFHSAPFAYSRQPINWAAGTTPSRLEASLSSSHRDRRRVQFSAGPGGVLPILVRQSGTFRETSSASCPTVSV